MGFLDAIGTIVDRVVPTVIGFAGGGPVGAIRSYAGVERAKKNEKIMERNMAYNDPFSGGYGSYGAQATPSYTGNRTSFFGDLGTTIGDFGRDVGGFVQDIAPALNLFGIGGGSQRPAPPAAQTIIRQRPDETSQSGEFLGANLGLAPALIGAGRRFLQSPGGQGALGIGAIGAGALMGGGGNGAPRITRKMKSDVRRIYMMAGMDPNATAQILNNLGTYPRMNFDASLVFFILTKRFRNDGPVVTKAAVRKTKTTLRRMKGVVDMYNNVCKPTTRRAPARRAAPKAVQLIKN
jgi:hypothetical protein